MSLFATPEQFATAGKANVEALLAIANTAFSSIERLSALNLNTARSVLEETISNTKAVLSAKDPQELLSLQTSLAQPLVEKVVSYNRSVYEITAQGQEALATLFKKQIADMNKNLNTTLDQAAKSAPAGSDVAVAAVKSAIAAANSAYDSVSKAARQVAEIAEANVNAATTATVKAVTTASKSSTGSKKTA